MKKVLLVTDRSPEAENAAMAAMRIATQLRAGLIVLDCGLPKKQSRVKAFAASNNGQISAQYDWQTGSSSNATYKVFESASNFQPDVNHFSLDEIKNQIGNFVQKNEVWLVLIGLKNNASQKGRPKPQHFDIQAIINKVPCPVMIIPENFIVSKFERIVYMTDLRYCRFDVIGFLSVFATSFDANLILAHIALNNLPDMDEQYASDTFDRTIKNRFANTLLFFTHIKERNLKKATEILTEVMQTDMIAFANHRFHFKEIIGENISSTCNHHVPVPLLIFPV